MRILLLLAVLFGVRASAKEMVLLGDSHSCSNFGRDLLTGLSRAGNQVTLYCAWSSSAGDWMQGRQPCKEITQVDGHSRCTAWYSCQTMTSAHPILQSCESKMPKFSEILQRHKGAEFLVALGTNSLCADGVVGEKDGCPKTDSTHPLGTSAYSKMLQALKQSGNDCAWVGPPHLIPNEAKGFSKHRLENEETNVDQFYLFLKSASPGVCRLEDSREWTKAGTPGGHTQDGVHRADGTPENQLPAKYWADKISAVILNPQPDGDKPPKGPTNKPGISN